MFKYRIFVITFLALLCGESLKAQNNDYKDGKNLELFFNVYNSVLLNYADTVDTDEVINTAIEAMLTGLDPYTEYYDAEAAKQFKISVSGKYGGLGSLIRRHYSDSTATQIAEVYEGQPADKAGLRAGDKILVIDGIDVKNKPLDEVSNLMKGDPGSTLEMVIAPSKDTTRRDTLTIKRQLISIPAVDYYALLSDSVGYVSLTTFSENCSEEVKSAILDLKNQGMKALILDLRSNGGGVLTEAVKILSYFVPKGSKVVEVKGREGFLKKDTYYTQQAPILPDIPLAVMVNKNSASASEIVAGAIQDLDRGVILGQRTFGKGLVQSTMSVGYDSSIKITIAKYYIPSGRCIQALDYFHKDKDGRAGAVPDSLRTEFTTLKGRKVYDGGGIMPDSLLKPDAMSRFYSFLYVTGYQDDFVYDYYAKHDEVPDIDTFKLTDKDWSDFKKYLETKEINYNYESEANLNKLIKSAKSEGHYEEILPYIEQIKAKIKVDNNRLLDEDREIIERYMVNMIIKSHHYAKGSIEYLIKYDEGIELAKSILLDTQVYNEILN
ncbi:MAG: S41 family peptidase [Rikenellaceae bacterium]